jgi:hypothetical protein
MEGQDYSTWEYDPAQQQFLQRPGDLHDSLMGQNLRGFDLFPMSGLEYRTGGTTLGTALDFPLVQTKEWDLMPPQFKTSQGTSTEYSDTPSSSNTSNLSNSFGIGDTSDLLIGGWSRRSNTSSFRSAGSGRSLASIPSLASLTSASSSSIPSSPFIDCFSSSSKAQLPKATRVSRTFKCWVDSCPDSIAGFAALKDRKRHYEIEHPDQILGCRIMGCKYQSFLKEKDRAKHEARMHATQQIEEAIETDTLPEVILDATQRVECRTSSSDTLCDKQGSLVR